MEPTGGRAGVGVGLWEGSPLLPFYSHSQRCPTFTILLSTYPHLYRFCRPSFYCICQSSCQWYPTAPPRRAGHHARPLLICYCIRGGSAPRRGSRSVRAYTSRSIAAPNITHRTTQHQSPRLRFLCTCLRTLLPGSSFSPRFTCEVRPSVRLFVCPSVCLSGLCTKITRLK